MENEPDQLWRLESQLYQGNIQDSLKALNKINNLWQVPDQDLSMIITILSKTFQGTSNIMLRQCIVDMLKRNFKFYHDKVQDWKKVIEYVSQDLFSNYYKLRMTSLECLSAIINKLDTQYDIYHLTFDTFLQAQEQVEVLLAFNTLRLLNKKYFQSSFMKKLDKLEFNKISTHKYQKISCILILLKENEFKELFQINLYSALILIYETIKPIAQMNDQLIFQLILHFLDIVSKCDYLKLIQQLFDEILLTQQFDEALSQQSQSFIQSFFLIMLKVLKRMPNKNIFTQPQKEKLVNFIHSLRDQTRGIQNLHNMTAIQHIIPKINSDFGISIEVKQNIFTLESKQYSQQSILIDEFFTKLIRLFQTNQVFQPDFLLKSYKTQLIDLGYQNIDKFLSDSLSNLRKTNHQFLFVSTQFMTFLSYLLELIVNEKLLSQGRSKKLQEQILFLNKLMGKYTLESYKILYEQGNYKKFNQDSLKKFTSQLIYLQYEIYGSFYLIENRDLALQDIVTEKSHRYLVENSQKFPFYFWSLISKISLNFGCLQQSQVYQTTLKSMNKSLCFDTYLDYVETLTDFMLHRREFKFLLDMNEFQTKSTQMNYRKNIISNYNLYFQVVEAVKTSQDLVSSFTQLAELEQIIETDMKIIQLIYGSQYSIDCYGPCLATLTKLISYLAQKIGLIYDLPVNQYFNQSSWIGLRLILSQDVIDLQEFVTLILLHSQRIPKILLQILNSPQLEVKHNKILEKSHDKSLGITFNIKALNLKSIENLKVQMEFKVIDSNTGVKMMETITYSKLQNIQPSHYEGTCQLLLTITHIGTFDLSYTTTLINEDSKLLTISQQLSFIID